MSYEVVDNFLPEHDFQRIKNLLLGDNFSWYFYPQISGENENKKLYYFIHTFFYDHAVRSPFFDHVYPLVRKVSPIALARFKANLYPNTNEAVQHGMHRDLSVPHKGAVFYVNTNNGFTVLEDGTKIESVENRILFFDSSTLHCSTSCTDEKIRVTLNMNYF